LKVILMKSPFMAKKSRSRK